MSGVRVRSLVGMRRDAGCSSRNLLDKAPAGWLSSREVAALKGGISVRAARAWLTRRGVAHVWVKAVPTGARLVWDGAAVRRELGCECFSDVLEGIPAGWCCSAEVGVILGCTRSSVSRFVARGKLTVRRARVRCGDGVRCLVLYKRAQVRGFKRAREQARDAVLRRRRAAYAPYWERMSNRAVFLRE